MALEVRRIVTGHDANGKAIVTTDERLAAVPRLNRPHIAGCEIWSTDKMPADNSAEADAAQRAGFVKRYNYVGSGQGTVIRVTEFAPGAPKFMHRTETVDYAILLSGECDLEFDSGEIVHMKQGDICVQRGTMHAWVNNGNGPAVFAFILIDAEPAEVNGEALRTITRCGERPRCRPCIRRSSKCSTPWPGPSCKPIEALTPAAARAQMEATARSRKAEPLPVARSEERLIPGPGGALRLRLYWPPPADPRRRAAASVPAILYYHGGGHVIGSLDTHDLVARNLCAGAEAVVASVDYRMGPEDKFPAAVEDAFAALQWVHENAASLGADPVRLGVHGDSAGANLAAVVALMARDAGSPMLRLQSLVYPVADYTFSGASYGKYARGYGVLTGEAMAWFRDHYLRSAADAEDWRASPLKAASLEGVAPAIVITAECDVLHDEGESYAAGLRQAGVAVEYQEYAGMIHGFLGMVPVVDDALNAQRQVWAAFKRAFA